MNNKLKEYQNGLTILAMDKVNKKIFKRKTLGKYLKSAQYSAVMAIANEIHSRHMENPYSTADEMLGDLQLLAVDADNEFIGMFGGESKTTLESMLGIFKEVNI